MEKPSSCVKSSSKAYMFCKGLFFCSLFNELGFDAPLFICYRVVGCFMSQHVLIPVSLFGITYAVIARPTLVTKLLQLEIVLFKLYPQHNFRNVSNFTYIMKFLYHPRTAAVSHNDYMHYYS